MLTTETRKLAPELIAAMGSHQYEVADDAIYFPATRVFASGEYIHDVNGQDERVDHNLIPAEALAYFLSVGLAGGTPLTPWYLALFAGAYTPAATLTAATFASAATEITSATEGYAESVRQIWTPGTIGAIGGAGQAVDNVAAKAAFTIRTATSLTIRGAGLLSDSTKGGVGGKLASAARFSTDRVNYDGDIFNLAYRIRLAVA